MPVTDLAVLALTAAEKETENDLFKQFLQEQDVAAIDAAVFALDKEITPQIDCTACGNCCRSLMINVDGQDAERLARHLHMHTDDFYERYVERSSQGTLAVMNNIPCHFLADNKCTVYEARPAECREFPGLHHAGFTKRLFAIFMHYQRCPIIFNVVEQLKDVTGFSTVNMHL
ncbi:YkgJ family cysteine cluster protein [Panacibacter sp. DH6]|uniref:YkgJ family cysteine cluster protein n=1 Tax=Panacibacter microcysteis TaxID=2793269 RepID=A0A931E4M7_9BACT|nr:YkgJ family cysteine cluster protein [Panacibacter microcysteis]MBG9375079.1 YkgJ family cysteine cluster protein [Panacibacter microcysteis]